MNQTIIGYIFKTLVVLVFVGFIIREFVSLRNEYRAKRTRSNAPPVARPKT